MAFGLCKLERGRQRHPELEPSQRLSTQRGPAMPNATASLHPFHAARVQRARLSGRIAVHQRALQQCRVRCDTRMRVHGSAVPLEARGLEVVEKDKRLYELAEIARAHQPRQRTLRVPFGSIGNATLCRW